MTDEPLEVFPEPDDGGHDDLAALDRDAGAPAQSPAATPPSRRSSRSSRSDRDSLEKLKREASRSAARASLITSIVVIVIGVFAWLFSFTLLKSSIDHHLRGGEVADKLEKVKAETENTNREIRILIEDTEAKIQQAIEKLSEGNKGYHDTAEQLISQLQANAMAAKRGFQLQVGKHFWTTGQEPVKMLHMSEGVCFLFFVSGKFDGVTDAVTVDLRPDGHWYLEGRAANPVRAGAISLRIIPVVGGEPVPPPG